MTGFSKFLMFGGNSSKKLLSTINLFNSTSICLKSTNSQLLNKQTKIKNLIFNQIRSSHGRQFNIRPGIFYTKFLWNIIVTKDTTHIFKLIIKYILYNRVYTV